MSDMDEDYVRGLMLFCQAVDEVANDGGAYAAEMQEILAISDGELEASWELYFSEPVDPEEIDADTIRWGVIERIIDDAQAAVPSGWTTGHRDPATGAPVIKRVEA